MKKRRSLVRQYMFFMAGLALVLSVGSFLITSQVTRSGLADLFRNRLERTPTVFAQYTKGNQVSRVGEIETLLTSPRFLAALETYDDDTVKREIPTHGVLSDAAFVCVLDPAGEPVFVSEGDGQEMHRRYGGSLRIDEEIECLTATLRGEVFEVVTAPIIANNGSRIGSLIVGRQLPRLYLEDLQRLTGFDIVLGLDGVVVAHSESDLLDSAADAAACLAIPPGVVERVGRGAGSVLAYRLDDSASGLSVAFVGSAEQVIAPIMGRVRLLLFCLAALGAVIAMFVVYTFTGRVGRRVRELGRHAQRIAAGDLDFRIDPGPADELGRLGHAFERMRADLKQRGAELDEAHRSQIGAERMAAIGQMATGIIHDFKNPMAVVRGTADLMRGRDPDNARVAKQCDVIHRQVDRMIGLTQDLLEYARGESALDVDRVDLAAWIADVCRNHEEASERRGVELVMEGPRDVVLLFDPNRLRRAIDNLVGNALDVSGPGDTVRLSWTRDDQDEVVLCVTDEGPGIPSEIASRIFEPFVTAGKKNGSGLGLAISRKVVEDHGASLEVVHGETRGAEFRIRFPAKLYVSGTREPAGEEIST